VKERALRRDLELKAIQSAVAQARGEARRGDDHANEKLERVKERAKLGGGRIKNSEEKN